MFSTAAISVLNAANADLQTLIGTLDLSATPDGTPSIPASSPAPAPTGKVHIPEAKLIGNRRASEPMQSSKTVGGIYERDKAEAKVLRRKSGSGVAQQVAAWPPVPPSKVSASAIENEVKSVKPRQRTRTSSSISNPPSAFNPKHTLIEKEGEVDVPSLTLRTLRAEQGNVQKKAKFYCELDKEAQLEKSLKNRRISQPDASEAVPRVRRRPVSFPALDSDSQSADDTVKVTTLRPVVDVVTDIPAELTDILLHQAKTDTAQPLASSPSPSHGPSRDDLALANVSSPTESSQEFIYNGVDAQIAQSPSSIAHSSDYSLCNEFSSYDEISRTEVVTVQPSQSVSSPADVFMGESHPPLHRTDQSIASLESVASYCVVSKRPPIQRIPPMVIHGKQPSIDSSNMSAEDTFAFAGENMPNVFGRSAHRRAGSIFSVTSTESGMSLGAMNRPGIGDKLFTFNGPLSDISASPSVDGNAKVGGISEPSSPSTIPASSPGSVLDGGYTSTDSLFDKPQHRMSSSSSIASVFGPNSSEKVSRGNLFGAVRPLSLVSNYSQVGMISDNEQQTPVRCLDGEVVRPKAFEPLSPCEQAQKTRLAVKPALRVVNIFEGAEKPPPTPVSDLTAKLSASERQPASRVRPRGSGHRRQQALYSRPHAITESICEAQEEVPDLYHSPSRSRGSSNTSTDTAGSTSESAVAIAEPEQENTMVLRRYYTFQREAQEEIGQSQLVWGDTPFSFDELSGEWNA
jgi:hypothetical protein